MHLIVGVSGASGAPLALELLTALKQKGVETTLVVSLGADRILRQELNMTKEELSALATRAEDNRNLGAAIASGSCRTDGMIICPCSMKTLGGIHAGCCEGLLGRAADVTLKERRRLVLVPRESPFSPIHLRNMYELSMMGAVILPPVLSYYNEPASVRDMTCHTVGKILDSFGLEYEGYRRWEGMPDAEF